MAGLSFLAYHFLTQQKQPSNSFEDISNLSRIIPHFSTQILEHDYYQAGYSEPHKQSEYIFYISKVEYLTPNFKRQDDFRPDPLVKGLSATLGDYRGSEYDRGHLLPAADMTFNKDALSETFYFSNISPQVPNLNRGIWYRLEDLVRQWVKEEGELIVITGPILEKEGYIKETIGKGQVTVPWGFYKIVFNSQDHRLIAFLLPNEPVPTGADLSDFVVSVRQVEEETGLNFFANLPEIWQDKWEQQINPSVWTW